MDIHFGNVQIVSRGAAAAFDFRKVQDIMKKDCLKITLDMKQGRENAKAYGCDMTYDYVKINAVYHT